MKKITSAVAICLLMVASYLAGKNHKSQHDERSNSRYVLYWVDPMHADYKSDHPGTAPDCGMKLAPVYAEDASKESIAGFMAQVPSETVSVDPPIQQLVGIQTATVEKSDGSRSLRVLGRVVPEDTRVYRIDAGSDGFVRETSGAVGTVVRKDQTLASCFGPEYLSVASGFLAAIAGGPGSAGKDGNRTVALPGAVSKQGFSSLKGYIDRLRNLGMGEVQINRIARTRQLPTSVDVVSPATGFILARSITPGQHFERLAEFYRIADLSRVWIVADVFGSEAQRVHPGTLAHVTLSAEGKTFTARVSDILPQVDPATRTLKLRLEADNPGFVLRPDMFVDVELPISRTRGLTVPVDAVIDSGQAQRVFVERANGTLEPRKVQTGWHFGSRVEIVEGLTEGEQVIASGTFLVDSESRLKAAQSASKQQSKNEELPPKTYTSSGVRVTDAKVKDAACGMIIANPPAVAKRRALTRGGVRYCAAPILARRSSTGAQSITQR